MLTDLFEESILCVTYLTIYLINRFMGLSWIEYISHFKSHDWIQPNISEVKSKEVSYLYSATKCFRIEHVI